MPDIIDEIEDDVIALKSQMQNVIGTPQIVGDVGRLGRVERKVERHEERMTAVEKRQDSIHLKLSLVLSGAVALATIAAQLLLKYLG